jgi:hypothetical protein
MTHSLKCGIQPARRRGAIVGPEGDGFRFRGNHVMFESTKEL